MDARHVRRLPVVDDQGRLVSDGVVTLASALDRESTVDVAVALSCGVDDVVDELCYRFDDPRGKTLRDHRRRVPLEPTPRPCRP
jgi:hypothetical protein